MPIAVGADVVDLNIRSPEFLQGLQTFPGGSRIDYQDIRNHRLGLEQGNHHVQGFDWAQVGDHYRDGVIPGLLAQATFEPWTAEIPGATGSHQGGVARPVV
jgi:hypothetical protein